jgi:tripartite-type tricarboxylate transporter receptor subunit TctC
MCGSVPGGVLMKRDVAWLWMLVAWLAACVGAHAAFPDRPVRLIVGQPGGDTTDLVARVIAPALSDFLTQRVIIDNHAGANGNLATARVAKTHPDGYTVLLASASFAANPGLYRNLAHQPARDFAPISRVATVHNVLVVHASTHAKTLAQFLAAIRANPSRTSFASGGNGSMSHLAAELMKQRVGPLNTLHVPYKGSGPAMAELIGGHVDALFVTMPYAFPHVRSGRIRALAVASLQRAAALPEVPTFDESGVRGFEAVSWNALVAPAGTPYDTIVRLNLGVAYAAHAPVVKERLGALGAEAASESPDRFAEYLRAEIAKWAKVATAAGITLD